MKLDVYVCNKSFDISMRGNSSLTECLGNLNDVSLHISKNDEPIFNPLSWYEQIIDNDQSIDEWLYDYSTQENIDEKLLLQEIIKQTVYIEEEEYSIAVNEIRKRESMASGNALLCLCQVDSCNPPENFNIHCIFDYLQVHRFYAHGLKSNSELFESFGYCFPNLRFSMNVVGALSIFKPLHDYIKEIMHHLIILNDQGIDIYKELGSTKESEMMKKLQTKLHCSGQGDPEYEKKNLIFPFVNNKGIQEYIKCAPHTKLFHQGSAFRIYFSWPHQNVDLGTSLLIGHIGRHL
ncbi:MULTISPECIES: hypothetical protein [Bacillus]|uniref:hypothetical protein n=1 Tax=Bacillus TaxID=1386 RepID=UPI000BEC9BBD|nr:MULTISPECIES: hypothetical protein [Bacillus]KAB2372582.1 hypothetical protein F8510_25845 [Bacillus sp. RM2(2019)]PEG02531.1 hypothetical protein CON54_22840 [Bacillus cereus]PFH98184.1 hypothetical protein COI64_28160 [Bacillus cereus]PGK97802.1 hypothetical protein CN910_08860 [Bacillus cereus]